MLDRDTAGMIQGVCDDIGHTVSRLREEFLTVVFAQQSPHVLMRPALLVDGNQFCALYGENLVNGIAGFGDTPAAAMADFDRNWHTYKLAERDAEMMEVRDGE